MLDATTTIRGMGSWRLREWVRLGWDGILDTRYYNNASSECDGFFVSFEPEPNIYTVPVTLSLLSIQMIISMKDPGWGGWHLPPGPQHVSSPWLCRCQGLVTPIMSADPPMVFSWRQSSWELHANNDLNFKEIGGKHEIMARNRSCIMSQFSYTDFVNQGLIINLNNRQLGYYHNWLVSKF